MKVVLQRVREARVTVEGKVVGEIGAGLLCLVGIGAADSADDISWVRNRILGARLWPHPDGRKRWDKSVTQLGYGVLLVSQFTLHGIFKGNKPDFHNSKRAAALFDELVADIRANYPQDRVATGAFGEYMDVSLVNDGPVTMIIDSEERSGTKTGRTPSATATPTPTPTPADTVQSVPPAGVDGVSGGAGAGASQAPSSSPPEQLGVPRD